MANPEHVEILKQGTDIWNKWRKNNTGILKPDFTNAELMDANLTGANLREAIFTSANLTRANLTRANLTETNFREANLTSANLTEANLKKANLAWAKLRGGANLIRANLTRANLTWSDFIGANLTEANISYASLIETNFTNATLNGCRVYGCSAWDLTLKGANQRDLVISKGNEPLITVDDLEVAQFIYLLINNEKIKHVIETITSKVVLILGRFTPERKTVLDEIRENLRNSDYLPILFDFDKPVTRDITETIGLLAHMARFVIADITDARSIPQELQMIVPNLPSVPVQPLLLETQSEYGMFEHFRHYKSVLPVILYNDEKVLLKSFKQTVIDPAEAKAKELAM